MVMQHRRRVLTVEEARNLPPPSPEETAQRERAFKAMQELREEILRERGGVPISEEDIEWALRWDDDEDEDDSNTPGLS